MQIVPFDYANAHILISLLQMRERGGVMQPSILRRRAVQGTVAPALLYLGAYVRSGFGNLATFPAANAAALPLAWAGAP